MKTKVQIRKTVVKNLHHVDFWLYKSDERCHIAAGHDEPDCFLMTSVAFIGVGYEISGYKSDMEAIKSLVDHCDREGYAVDLDIPAFEHDRWDGSLRRLPELDQQIPGDYIVPYKNICWLMGVGRFHQIVEVHTGKKEKDAWHWLEDWILFAKSDSKPQTSKAIKSLEAKALKKLEEEAGWMNTGSRLVEAPEEYAIACYFPGEAHLHFSGWLHPTDIKDLTNADRSAFWKYYGKYHTGVIPSVVFKASRI